MKDERHFKHNYHTHTYLCNHAEGTIRDYVEAALEGGMETIGFSCHAPYPFGERFRSWYRMTSDQMDIYVSEILSLKDEFAGKIDVKLGYEAEYYPALWEELLREIKKYPCDYIILGQHFFNNEYDGNYAGDWVSDIRSVKAYARILSEGMKTGLYTYVAHPDLNSYTGDIDEYVSAMSQVFETSLETDTPLEINLLGIRGRRSYPKEQFWREAGKYGVKVVFGSDAHDADCLKRDEDFRRALEIVDKYGLNYVENVKLRKIK
ncbi:MAG: histidinol-phosphatase [Clostridia bacterium]|nr:histidinol-phosphatase [Clostridia bacterium]